MKIKTLTIVLTLTLAILSTGVTAQTFQTSGEGTIEWSNRRSFTGGYSIYLTAPKIKEGTTAYQFMSGPHEARIRILMPNGTTLKDIEEISWMTYVVAGYPPHVDILLDMDDDGEFNSKKDMVTGFLKSGPGDVDDILVAEFAYQGSPMHYPSTIQYSEFINFTNWVNTFTGNNDPDIIVNNDTLFWLYSAAPGAPGSSGCPYPFLDGKLSEWKDGKPRTHTWEWNFTGINCNVHSENDVNGDTFVYGIEIEVDGWIAESKCYIDDIEIKGKNLDLTNTILFQLKKPEIYDLEARVVSLENIIQGLKNSVQELLDRFREITGYLDDINKYLNTSYGEHYGLPVKGFCGDNICDANLGENINTCSQDCKDGGRPGETYLTLGWKVTCPGTFVNATNHTLTTDHCRTEMFRGIESMANETLKVGYSKSVNKNAGYSLKLYGIPK
jgi:hypothetical protein